MDVLHGVQDRPKQMKPTMTEEYGKINNTNAKMVDSVLVLMDGERLSRVRRFVCACEL